MRNNKIGKRVYDILENMGIRIIISRFANWKTAHYNEKYPTEQMKNSRVFFTKNKIRINNAINLLEDAESKETLKKMIDFRCFSVYKELPRNSMRSQYFLNNFFEYSKEEVFVDCGAYDGDSIIGFKN